jgi:hypothetical protein
MLSFTASQASLFVTEFILVLLYRRVVKQDADERIDISLERDSRKASLIARYALYEANLLSLEESSTMSHSELRILFGTFPRIKKSISDNCTCWNFFGKDISSERIYVLRRYDLWRESLSANELRFLQFCREFDLVPDVLPHQYHIFSEGKPWLIDLASLESSAIAEAEKDSIEQIYQVMSDGECSDLMILKQ